MTQQSGSNEIVARTMSSRTSTSGEKARLLAWAAESDARAHKAWSGVRTLVGGGALAVLSGLAVANALGQRRSNSVPHRLVQRVGQRLISWALLARAGKWLLPIVIRAVRNRRVDHTPDVRRIRVVNRSQYAQNMPRGTPASGR